MTTRLSVVLSILILIFLASYYEPPTARGIVDPPLKGHQSLPVGYGDFEFLPAGYGESVTIPRTFFLREGQDVEVGILKLFLTREQVDFSNIIQSSPFDYIYTTKVDLPVRLWDSILIPVVQRRPRKSRS